MSSYHNTNRLQGNLLVLAEEKATSQEGLVLQYFRMFPLATPEQVHRVCFGNDVPLTSTRRAITNLTRAGKLMKTDKMGAGQYGQPVHYWMLAE